MFCLLAVLIYLLGFKCQTALLTLTKTRLKDPRYSIEGKTKGLTTVFKKVRKDSLK